MSTNGVLKIAVSAIGRFHMFDLARQLLARGHNVQVFTGNPKLRVDADLRCVARTHPYWRVASACARRLFGVRSGGWLQDREYRSYGKWLCRQINPSRVDILDGLDGIGPSAGRKMKAAGKKWVCNRGSAHVVVQRQLLVEEHSIWGATPPNFTERLLQDTLAEYSECDAIVVPSTFAKRSFEQQGVPASKIHIIPYGVDLQMFKRGVKRDKVFRVLFVGTFSLQKGIGYLLDAIAKLAMRGHLEMWIAGPIDPAADLLFKRYQNVFSYHGVIARAELWKLYTQCSVLVLPSVQDGFGLVMAQAMACGLPVIATTNTGALDLFQDAKEGFIVPIRDSQAIREKIELLMGDISLHREMASQAESVVKSLGGWECYGRACENLYRSLQSAT